MLKAEDGLLTEIDHELPAGRHVRGVVEHIDMVKDIVAEGFVAAQEVVVGDPESNGVVGTLKIVVTAGITVRSVKSAV